jgi:cytochrome oxidase Cu insertion factor (SCO1/SenC/PrrC family)
MHSVYHVWGIQVKLPYTSIKVLFKRMEISWTIREALRDLDFNYSTSHNQEPNLIDTQGQNMKTLQNTEC